jgi:hypothetical protein
MGLFDDLTDLIGGAVGMVCGIAVAPIAIALGVSEKLVAAAIRAGCRTKREIEEWIEENT